ncbi:sulfurtransferase-like selenium metabolism protein YedF [Campylobacter sp. faydin G-105]|uniref:sulfurtransferase-like selenium metabolism protein YedF n=1 Tax=Campylobacter anatolicus TaxID=2829105 RepID=UPI001B9409CB|nr:sulfurtransferase-like selenium metabolism protein YedF [Campylobacter anatolicus]MBR8461647.1 sulfurtransferase-like selenium metabolism protein YedF [Campylobacter anatolicus]
MQLDCRNLACPEPVIRTKLTLNTLKDGESLEILLNSLASYENVSKFLTSLNQKFERYELGSGEYSIKAIKSGVVSADTDVSEYTCEVAPAKRQKVVYLNEERAGSGEVGMGLLSKFLGAFLQVEDKPYAVICVNSAVKITTDRSHVSFRPLKDLEAQGVKILSCGSCLEAYKLVDKLSVGEITNAFEVVDILSKFDEIKL